MRRLPAVLAVAVAVPAVLTLPTVTPPRAQPRPVAPTVTSLPLRGVDATALAAAPRPGPSRAGAAAPERPALLTGELATEPYRALGVTWRDGAAVDGLVVRVRTRTDGRWSGWRELEVSSADGPDEGSYDATPGRVRGGTPPYVPGLSDGVQVRIDAPAAGPALPADLRVDLVDPGTSPADAALAPAAPVASADAAATRPTIVSRAAWGADESMRDGFSGYGETIKVGWVHHTVSTNSYSPSESAAIVRSIYAYHVQGRGWSDIGYNFLVDRYGTVFEGRWGGITAPVIGAHTGGFNTNTFAASAIGDFESSSPPSATLRSLAKLMAWKLDFYGRDPVDSTVLVSGGHPTSRWDEGAEVEFDRISGHRDAGLTACPGRYLYAQLGTIRSAADAYAATTGETPRADVEAVRFAGTASGRVEVHGLARAREYDAFVRHAATAFAATSPADWRYVVAPFRGSGRPDLFGIRLRGGSSGRVEVHVLTAASGYRDFALHAATAMPALRAGELANYAVAVAGSPEADVYVVKLRGASGKVEVHTLAEAAGYRSWSLHAATALPAVSPAGWEFLVDTRSGPGDLIVVKHAATGSGRTEVHRLSRASTYQTWTLHSATPLGYTTDDQWTYALGDHDSDGRSDLYALRMAGTGTGTTERHVLRGRTGYREWITRTGTALHQTSRSQWSFSVW